MSEERDQKCPECEAAMLARVQEASELPAPKITLCINAHNEGPDLLQTVKSVRRAYDGLLDVVIIADGTTDGSDKAVGEHFTQVGYKRARAKNKTLIGVPFRLRRLSGSDGQTVQLVHISPKHGRVGCGKAKQLGTLLADDGPILYMDGHCRVLKGDLNLMARICDKHDWILCPGVAPLNCDPDDPGVDFPFKGGSTSYGAYIFVASKGCKYESQWKPKKPLEARSAPWNAIFMMSRRVVLDRLGGWNEYPGRWGSQEIGLALRSWFADVPMYAWRDTVAAHRYQSWWKGSKGKSWKERHPESKHRYDIRSSERRANHIYSHMLVFGDKAVEQVWKPLWAVACPSEGGWERLKDSGIEEARADFQENYKRRTDEEFWREFSRDGLPVAPIPTSDITAVILAYRRPVNVQKCVTAIRAAGVDNVWLWANDGATVPDGVTRTFTDSENGMTWPRYAIAGMVETPWIFYCDDDCEITEEGMMGLRIGASKHPRGNLGLIGARFNLPYDNYNKRVFFHSHRIDKAEPVDMIWPKGQLISRDLAQEIYGCSDLWQRMRNEVGSSSGDDLIATVAQSLLGHPPALIVPSDKVGYKEHHAEGKDSALCKIPGRLKAKRHTVRMWQREFEWETVGQKKERENEL